MLMFRAFSYFVLPFFIYPFTHFELSLMLGHFFGCRPVYLPATRPVYRITITMPLLEKKHYYMYFQSVIGVGTDDCGSPAEK